MRLGPFELKEQVGEGGMGRVYRASHVSQPIDVAIKVVTSERARKTRYREAFAREVRAVAALDHYGIIGVHDFGKVTAEAERASGGELVRDSPYIVMEYVGGGTLKERANTMTWPELKVSCLMILDALSHAHARGLIHRDLKPTNIMVGQEEGTGRAILKLTDFGLAHAIPTSLVSPDDSDVIEMAEIDPSRRRILGTPSYMAPEQVEAEYRDLGPWTDLYALGCLVYRLATGTPPFVHPDRVEVLRAHLRERVPELRPRFPVPVGLQDWLYKLLAKEPTRRFTRAADAAYALLNLDEREMMEPVLKSTDDFPDDAPTLVDMRATSGSSMTGEWKILKPRLEAMNAIPPIPSTWRLSERQPPPQRPILDAGLGLYGLRTIRMVGRENERDLLWNTLRIVGQDRGPRALIVQGGPGVGKSRLVQSFCERAHELGAANVFAAHHAPEPARIPPIAAMVRDFVRAGGLARNGVLARLRMFLPGNVGGDLLLELLALAELIAPGTQGTEDSRLTITSLEERYAAVARFLEGIAAERPVVVWLDDVQWSIEAIGFAAHVLNASNANIVIVMTVREDLLQTRQFESRLLASLRAEHSIDAIQLHELPTRAQRELVTTLLGLDGRLSEEVLERTGGNPLFAIQLVGDWVERGVLVPGGAGFKLRSGEDAAIPDHIHDLWRRRVDDLVHAYDEAIQGAVEELLEIGAALGERVDLDEWETVLRRTEAPADLVERMTGSRLATVNDDGTWSFTHGMLRESIARNATDAGRWRQIHRRCVQFLKSHYDQISGSVAERIARHFLDAGEPMSSLDYLQRAAENAYSAGEHERGLRLLGLREDALREGGVPQFDERWADMYVLRSRMLVEYGDLDEAEELAEELARVSRPLGWKNQERLDYLRAILMQRRGRLREACELFATALENSDPQDLDFYGSVAQGYAVALTAIGESELALEHYTLAERSYTQTGDLSGVTSALGGMAQVYLNRQEWKIAGDLLERSRAILEEIGNRNGLSRTLNDIGDLNRRQGRPREAEASYRASRRLMEAIGSKFVGVPTINLALACLAQDHFDEGLEHAREAAESLKQRGLLGLAAFAPLVPLAVYAERGERENFERCLKDVVELVRIGTVEIDVAEVCLRAASAALRQRWQAPSLTLFGISRDQFAALGDETRAAEINEIIAMSFDF